jgi:heme oxygenase (mycobilin-producing)
MPIAITAYETSPEADERFTATWERAAPPAAVLHRALRADVDFRFVAVGAGPLPELPFSAHAGEYGVAREDGTPDVAGGVVLMNPFEVPEGDDETFLDGWERARGTLAPQRGYLGTRLHRAAGPADFRFVNVARWSSPLMFARALGVPEFAEAARAIPFPSHPALYLELT